MNQQLKPDALALLVYMARIAQPDEDAWAAATALGINHKRAFGVIAKLRGLGLVSTGFKLSKLGSAHANKIAAGINAAREKDGGSASLFDVLRELVVRNSRSEPEAEQRRPNARDLVGAAIIDIDWRLERGRRQRNHARRCQLREARWLLQRAAAVLAADFARNYYTSPHGGKHGEDEVVAFVPLPKPLEPGYRTGGTSELYRRTSSGSR